MSDLNITLTTQDIDLLKKSYDPNARFSVLGVFEYQKRAPVLLPDETRSHRYVITGGLGSKQTENSILRWINDYYDELLLQDPEARITIAGSNPSDNLINTLKINIKDLIAYPEYMDPILTYEYFYLCPVDCGGGLKLRNLDGLKYGLPVLTHKVSLRGYEKMEREGVVFSYATRDQFKESLKQMLSITVSRKEIQRLYLEQYQYEKGVDRLRQILNESGLE